MFYIKQNETTPTRCRVPIYLVSATDGYTPQSGVTTPSIAISKNGSAAAAGAGSVVEVGNGVYYYQFAASELDTLGWVRLRCTKSGQTRDYNAIVYIMAYDAYDGTRFGLSALPAST